MGVTQIDAMAQIAPEDVPTATWDGVGEPPPEMLLAHMDTNGDGVLDVQELGAGEDDSEFRQVDKNGDGLIDVNELGDFMPSVLKEMKEDSAIEEAPPEVDIKVGGAEFKCQCLRFGAVHEPDDQGRSTNPCRLKGVTCDNLNNCYVTYHNLNGTYKRDGDYLGLPMYTCQETGVMIRVLNDVCVGDAVQVQYGSSPVSWRTGVVTVVSAANRTSDELFDIQIDEVSNLGEQQSPDVETNISGSDLRPITTKGDRIIVIAQEHRDISQQATYAH